jgi:hypothetical protein
MTKGNGHGGKRPGAGRKPGSGKITELVEITERMEATGEEVKVVKPIGEAVCDLLKIGHSPEQVMEAVGLSRGSYYAWRQRGMDAAAKLGEGYEVPDEELDYLDFLHKSQHARGELQRRLEARLADLVPTMEPREVTDVLARLDKVKWSKASSMKLDVSGELNVVEHHGVAVARLLRDVIDGLLEHVPASKREKVRREVAPALVQAALARVVQTEERPLPSG